MNKGDLLAAGNTATATDIDITLPNGNTITATLSRVHADDSATSGKASKQPLCVQAALPRGKGGRRLQKTKPTLTCPGDKGSATGPSLPNANATAAVWTGGLLQDPSARVTISATPGQWGVGCILCRAHLDRGHHQSDWQ